jgi:isohexenylglutaconyl-CoA hydratase
MEGKKSLMYVGLRSPFETIMTERVRSVVHLTLNRPRARNAMNQCMVEEIRNFFVSIRDDRTIRSVVIRGAGPHFCAGADIKEMRDPAHQTAEAQFSYASALDKMLRAVQRAPQVTIAAVEGAAMGGGFGLVCVTDIAVADESLKMALPEVRLGIAPAVVSPYVIERIGLTRTRQLALTARFLDGQAALDLGLVQDVAPMGMIEMVVDEYLNDILKGSPNALAATKELLFRVAATPSLDESRAYRIETLGRLRSSEEGREGMAAFAEKRTPFWESNERGRAMAFN